MDTLLVRTMPERPAPANPRVWLAGILLGSIALLPGSVRAETVTAIVDLLPPAHGEAAEAVEWQSVLAVIPHEHQAVAARAFVVEGDGAPVARPDSGTGAAPSGRHGHAAGGALAGGRHETDTGPQLATRGLATWGYDGFQVATLAVAAEVPGADGHTRRVRRARVEITTRPGGRPALQRLRSDPRRDARLQRRLSHQVVNPAALVEYAPPRPPQPQRKSAAAPGGFLPSFDPSLVGSGVRYLIITTEEFVPAFQPLADWKTARGMPAQIRTVEWIESRTRQGIDRPETIRNFLIEAYQLWGIEWVLLGGDTGVIPARYGRTSLYPNTQDEYSPTDMYFSCLDGTWNEDGDAVWGEGATAEDPSEADILPELFVARAPVNDLSEVQFFVNKILAYESPVYTDYQHKALLLHEVLVPANWDSGEAIAYDGAVIGEQMVSASLPPEVVPTRLYDTYWMYPGSSQLSKALTISELNAAHGVVNQLGHGYRYNMSVGDQSLVNADADVLSNTDRSFLLFLANCTAVAFDFNCLAEPFLLNPGGGAAGVIGASRSVSAIFVTFYNSALFRQLYEFDQVHLAQLLNSARLERSALANNDSQDRQLHFSLNALGDPEMRVFTGPVAYTL
ncbi:MAG: C25 family cysteine peptidase, partial [Candidatus Krumholzibacteriia bacterium]